MPSIGGGTKLIRTLRAGAAEGVCSGAGEAVTDSSGEITGQGDFPAIAEEVGVGGSCAVATEAKLAIRNAKLIILVMSGEMETSGTLPKVSRDSSTSLGMTSGLDVIAPVHIRKKIVAPLAIAQEVFVELIADKLIV